MIQTTDTLVPYTFEESLANWADALESDADDADERGPRRTVRLTSDQARRLAGELRGAARLIEQESAR